MVTETSSRNLVIIFQPKGATIASRVQTASLLLLPLRDLLRRRGAPGPAAADADAAAAARASAPAPSFSPFFSLFRFLPKLINPLRFPMTAIDGDRRILFCTFQFTTSVKKIGPFLLFCLLSSSSRI